MRTQWKDILTQTVLLTCLLCLSSCTITISDPTILTGLIPSYDEDSVPFPNALKCYVCRGPNNTSCMADVVNAFCPQGTKYCRTEHHFNASDKESTQVLKTCAQDIDCSEIQIGCFATTDRNIKKCSTCCDWTWCNEDIPTNASTAIFATQPTLIDNSSSNFLVSSTKLLFFMLCTGFIMMRR
ncbi:ly6/PLAUR domain-containing protein 6B-like [Glandiceps talaboti]